MPVTFAHPALVFPLKRTRLVFSALVAGSMMPDFEFFLRLSSDRLIAHTIHGTFLFSIPVGLISLWVFHRVIKYPLLSLFSHRHRAGLFAVAQRFRFFPLSRFLTIILSLGIGAFSHVAWDAITHPEGLTLELLPFMAIPLVTIPQGTIRVYFALQYVTSAIGIAYMIWSYLGWINSRRGLAKALPHGFGTAARIGIALSMGVFSFVGGALYGLASTPHFGTVAMVKAFVSRTAVASVSSSLIAVVTFGVLWHFLIPHHRRVRVLHEPRSPQGAIEEQTVLP